MQTQRQKTGKRGEDEACRYLEDLGHTVLARNWRSGRVELDIITLAPDGIHFVEVKSRTAPALAPPEANVNKAKMKNVITAAGRFMNSAGKGIRPDAEIFFDVISVVFDRNGTEINYFPSAFIPIWC